MPSAGFEPATPATKRPQTYPLDRAATEIGHTETKKLYTFWLAASTFCIRNQPGKI
jgi:hypothetical protein